MIPRTTTIGDDDLRALFEREPARVTEQPFVNEIARRVAAPPPAPRRSLCVAAQALRSAR